MDECNPSIYKKLVAWRDQYVHPEIRQITITTLAINDLYRETEQWKFCVILESINKDEKVRDTHKDSVREYFEEVGIGKVKLAVIECSSKLVKNSEIVKDDVNIVLVQSPESESSE